MREVIVTGKTVEEATEQACLQLGLPREEVSIEILELPTRKLFKSTPAKVRATAEGGEPAPAPAPAPQPPVQQAAPAPQKRPNPPGPQTGIRLCHGGAPCGHRVQRKAHRCGGILKNRVCRHGRGEVTLTAVKQGEATILKVEGSDVGVLIGHRGETMESLSYLAGLVANRLPGDYLKLGLDVGGYRSKREKDLESLARRIGAKVAKTGRSHVMDPMNPYERRIIHSAIGAMQGVRSESKGEGADRRVVIYSTDPNASNLPERREGGRGRSDRGEGRARAVTAAGPAATAAMAAATAATGAARAATGAASAVPACPSANLPIPPPRGRRAHGSQAHPTHRRRRGPGPLRQGRAVNPIAKRNAGNSAGVPFLWLRGALGLHIPRPALWKTGGF